MLARIALLCCLLSAASSQSGVYTHTHVNGSCLNSAGPATGPAPLDTCNGGPGSYSKFQCIGGSTYIVNYGPADSTCANAIESIVKFPAGACQSGQSFSCNGTTNATEAGLLGTRNWAKAQYWNDNTCTTTASFTFWGWMNTTCQVNNMGMFGTTSSKQFCTNGVPGSAGYSDATCGTMTQFFSSNANACIQAQMSAGLTYYIQQSCIGSVPAPTSGLGNAATFQSYMTTGCTGSYLATGAVTVGACLNEGGGNYSMATCSGTSTTFTMYNASCTGNVLETHTWAVGTCNPLPGSGGSYVKAQTCGTTFDPSNPNPAPGTTAAPGSNTTAGGGTTAAPSSATMVMGAAAAAFVVQIAAAAFFM